MIAIRISCCACAFFTARCYAAPDGRFGEHEASPRDSQVVSLLQVSVGKAYWDAPVDTTVDTDSLPEDEGYYSPQADAITDGYSAPWDDFLNWWLDRETDTPSEKDAYQGPQADAITDSDSASWDDFLKAWLAREEENNFPAVGDWMDSEAGIEARLNSAIADGRKDPCNAQIQVSWQDNIYLGLGCEAMQMVDAMFAGIYTGMSMAMRTDNASYSAKGWADIFTNAAGIPICHQKEDMSPKCCGYLFGESIRIPLYSSDHYDKNVTEGRLSRVMHVIGKKILNFQPDVRNALDARLNDLGLGEGVKYIGVHIRRGDKVTEDPVVVPTQKFSDAIHDAADRIGSKIVFLASDDPNAESELSGLLGSDYKLIYCRSGDDPRHQDRSYKDKAKLLSVLTDVHALARSTSFIGTATSKTSRLAWILRDSSAESISLEASFLGVA